MDLYDLDRVKCREVSVELKFEFGENPTQFVKSFPVVLVIMFYKLRRS